MIPKLYAYGEQLCGKRMSYGSVHLSGRKADPPFPGLLRGLGQSRKK